MRDGDALSGIVLIAGAVIGPVLAFVLGALASGLLAWAALGALMIAGVILGAVLLARPAKEARK